MPFSQEIFLGKLYFTDRSIVSFVTKANAIFAAAMNHLFLRTTSRMNIEMPDDQKSTERETNAA